MFRALRPAAVALAALVAGCSRYPTAPDFTLTDQNGASWTLSQQHGKAVALFFGFTHCQDTCPTTLAKLSKAIAPDRDHTVIAFVTVDPERDSPQVLNAYLKRFDAPVAGLTGTRAQIDAVQRSYHVWSQKIPGKRGHDDYDEAHIATVIFIDPSGHQRTLADQTDSVESLASDVKTVLQ